MRFLYSFVFTLLTVSLAMGQLLEECLTINGYAEGLFTSYNYLYNTSTIKTNASKEIALIGNLGIYRISKEGNKQWEKTVSGIRDFSIDKDGGLYVIDNLATLTKYNNNGALAWQKTNTNSQWSKIIVDNANNVHIVGYDYSLSQLVVRKYSASGTQLWAKLISNIWNGTIALSTSGELYVLAEDYSVGGLQLIKYSSSGTQLWSKVINYNFYIRQIAVGQDGNLYAFLSDDYSTRIMKINPTTGSTLAETLLDLGNPVFEAGPGNSFYLLGNSFSSTQIHNVDSNLNSVLFFDSGQDRSSYYKSLKVDTDGSVIINFNITTVYSVFIRVNSSGQSENTLSFSQLTTGLVIDYQGSYLVPTENECLKKLRPCDKLPLEIVSNPANKTICALTDTAFGITANGTNLLFQWYKNDTPLTNGTKYSGVNTSVLSIKSADPIDDSGNFFCEVIDICNRSIYSNNAYITFIQQPSITTQPSSVIQCAGTDAVFQIATSGGQNVKYQWRKGDIALVEGTNVIGSKTAKLTLKGITAADVGDYYCDITSDCYTSPIVTQKGSLALTQPPIISSQPAATTACIGASAIFTLSATGSNVTYQWRKGGVNLTESTVNAGTKTNTLTIKDIKLTDVGDYSCLVTDACGNVVISSNASLTVTPVTQILSQPANKAACTGAQTTFSITASGTSLVYSWKKGNTVLSNGSKYSGATTNVLTVSSIAAADEGYYTCTVSNPCGNDIVSNAATLTIATAPSILAKSGDLSLCAGKVAYLSITASGSGLSYQWKRNGVSLLAGSGISGINSPELIIAAAQLSDAGDYTCEVSSGCGSNQTSGVIKLAIQSEVAISTQPVSQQGCLGGNVSFTVGNTGAVQTYQWKRNGVTIVNNSRVEGANSSVLTIKNLTSADEGQYSCEITSTCGNITASGGAQLTVNQNPDLVLLTVDCESFVPEWPSLVADNNNTFGEYVLFEKGKTTPIPDLLSIPKTGVYVIVKSTGSCADSIEWNNTCIVTGIEDETNEITIFPNPSPDLFKISHPPIEAVRLFDQKGVEVMVVRPDSENETTVNGAQLSTGLYHAVFYTRSRRVLFHRIIVNR